MFLFSDNNLALTIRFSQRWELFDENEFIRVFRRFENKQRNCAFPSSVAER
jgi:hypothetical protein